MGVLTALFGIAFLYVSAYMIPGVVEMMPDSFLKTLFWVGYLIQIIIGILIKPFLMIVKDQEGSPFSVAQGSISFVLGIILSLILYYLFDSFFGISGVFTGDMALAGDLTGMMWFAYILITVIAMVIGPAYIAFEEPYTEQISEQLGIQG